MTRFRLLVVFERSGALLALAAEHVAEILPLPLLSRPPGTPPLISGFLNFGGRPVAVLDPARMFELRAAAPGPYAHLILLEDATPPRALLADRALDTVGVAPGELRPAAEGHALNGCIEAEFAFDGRSAALVDPARLLLKEEELRLGELGEMERARLAGLDGGGA